MSKRVEERLDKRFSDVLGAMDSAYVIEANKMSAVKSQELLSLMNSPPRVTNPNEYEVRMREHNEGVKKKQADIESEKAKGYTQAALDAFLNNDAFMRTCAMLGSEPAVSLISAGLQERLAAERTRLEKADKAEIRGTATEYLAAVQRFLLGAGGPAEPEGTTEEQLLRIKREQGGLNAQRLMRTNYGLYKLACRKYGTFKAVKAVTENLENEAEERALAVTQEGKDHVEVVKSYEEVQGAGERLPSLGLVNGERKIFYTLSRRGSVSAAELQKETGASDLHMKSVQQKLIADGCMVIRPLVGEPADTWCMTTKGRRAVIADAMNDYRMGGSDSGNGSEWVGAVEEFLYGKWDRLDRKGTDEIRVRKADLAKEEGATINGVWIPPRERLEKLQEAGVIVLEGDINYITIKRKVKR